MKNNVFIPTLTHKDIQRFWSKVNVSSSEECWEWNASKSKTGGYGKFRIGTTIFAAHRISYFIANIKDPGDLLCCHTCDNRACVNPNHIFIGTQQDNIDDMISKGRKATTINPLKIRNGENAPNSKLSSNQVLEIVTLYSKGHSGLSIAKDYGVSGATIQKILNGDSWKTLKLPIQEIRVIRNKFAGELVV